MATIPVLKRTDKLQGMLHFAEGGESDSQAPWSVSRLNREVRGCLETRIGAVWVEGEISNLRRQPSGHQYFSLKDEYAQVSCVMFRSVGGSTSLQDGMRVEVRGAIGVYEPRGQYQIVVQRVRPRGEGELEARLRQLQEKLRTEGLLDHTRKRTLPPHPSRVGVVTSPVGAAIRDFLQILRRRAPHIAVFIAPVRVQGRGAAAEIAAAIGQFSDAARSGFPAVDVIVVTRGGGSLEDLWEFNEESVARAIAASAVPVISAVGHETDVTTSDLVADVRAPTPSAAAEILSSDRGEMLERLRTGTRRLTRDVSIHLQRARAKLSAMTDSGVFVRPARRLSDLRQRNDDMTEQAAAAIDARLEFLRNALSKTSAVLAARSPARQLTVWGQRLSALQRQQGQAIAAALRQRKQAAARQAQAMELLGPQRTLQRGFTVTMDTRRRPLASAQRAAGEKEIITVFADGEIKSNPV